MLYGLAWLPSRQATDCIKTLNNGCFYQRVHWANAHAFVATHSDALPVYYYRHARKKAEDSGGCEVGKYSKDKWKRRSKGADSGWVNMTQVVRVGFYFRDKKKKPTKISDWTAWSLDSFKLVSVWKTHDLYWFLHVPVFIMYAHTHREQHDHTGRDRSTEKGWGWSTVYLWKYNPVNRLWML